MKIQNDNFHVFFNEFKKNYLKNYQLQLIINLSTGFIYKIYKFMKLWRKIT